MRVSRRLKDLHLELKAASEQLAHDLGRSPTVDELADALDCTPEDVLEALEAGAAYRATSLTAGLGSEEGEEIVPGERDEELEDTSVRVLLQEALGTLPERERRVVYLRFYLGPDPERDRRGDRREPGARVADPAQHPHPARRRAR